MNRYNIGVVCAKDVTPTWAARKSPTGKFVRYEDCAAMIAERDRELSALREINKRLKSNIKQHCAACSIPLPGSRRPNIYCAGAACVLRHTYLLEETAFTPKGAGEKGVDGEPTCAGQRGKEKEGA
jgi:hypothetical protein